MFCIPHGAGKVLLEKLYQSIIAKSTYSICCIQQVQTYINTLCIECIQITCTYMHGHGSSFTLIYNHMTAHHHMITNTTKANNYSGYASVTSRACTLARSCNWNGVRDSPKSVLSIPLSSLALAWASRKVFYIISYTYRHWEHFQ